MKKYRFLSLMLAVALVLVSCPGLALPASAKEEMTAGGWLESLYAQIPGITDSQVTAVSYSGSVSGELTGEDLKYLVRDLDGGVRIDIPGLKPGSYSLQVTTDAGVFTEDGIEVLAHDRSGYAHWNYDRGVGAYKDDGTLKDNALVIYVTDENKDTVTVTASDGTTVTGIGNILNTGGSKSNKGSKVNTNQDILYKLACDGTPLVVRIVGTVSPPQGLTAWGSTDYGGNVDDNGYMARMQRWRDITIEGIGSDAVVNGWGFSAICQSGNRALGLGESFELRNVTFTNAPEDCMGLEGVRSGSSLTDPIERCWVHNCAFYGPRNIKDASDDQDKDGGDGACDFKRGQYFTMSYCYYYGYHKTNLVGGSDSDVQYNITWHHNYYKNCESRAPLGRQANMHMYNNLFEGQSSYCMSLRANCYIFSEYNQYINCKKVTDGNSGGVCKSFGNVFTNCTGTGNKNLIVVTDRNQAVDSKNKYANFDTDPEYGYVAQGDYLLDTDVAQAKQNVMTYAGSMHCSFKEPAVVKPVIPGTPDTPTDTPEDPGTEPPKIETDASSYIHDFTQSGLNSDFFAFKGNLSQKGTVVFDGKELTQCLKIESSTSISFTAPVSGTLALVFGGSTPAAGKSIKIDGAKTTISSEQTLLVSVSVGEHTVTKGDYIFLYYMIYTPDIKEVTVHKNEKGVVTAVDVNPRAGTTELSVGASLPTVRTAEQAPVITINTAQPVTLVITMDLAEWGNVACAVAEDGSLTVLPETEVTEDGVKITLNRSCRIVVVNRAIPFADTAGYWSNDELENGLGYLTARGIIAGKTADTFVPGENIQRRTVALVLWRMAGSPEVSVDTALTDVNLNDIYTQAICWAEDTGIITGYSDGTFRGENQLERRHFALMLYRFAKYMKIELDGETVKSLEQFPDSENIGLSSWEACQWAVDNGIINGRGNGTFDPNGTTTRGQMAVILFRFLNR